jgi:hypothetical protein
MRRKQEKMLRLAAILLLSGIFAGQLAGVLYLHAVGKTMGRGAFLLADGPAPPPTPPPLR